MAYVSIVILENDHQAPVGDVINSQDRLRSLGINRSLALLFEEYDIYIAKKPKRLGPLQLMDAYGNPLICLTRDEAIKRHIPEELIGNRRSVILYSAGPNGKDEEARGDDIFWPEP